MGARQKVAMLRRISHRDGQVLHYQIMGNGRPEFLPVDAVPAFEGDEAWFVLEAVQARPWNTWRVVRPASENDHRPAIEREAPGSGRDWPSPDGISYPGSPDINSPFRAWSDWNADPWALPHVTAARRKERNARWVASLSDRDWERLARLADTSDGIVPAALADLDAPIRVGVMPLGQSHSGERFGTLRGMQLVAWPKERPRKAR